MRAPQAASDLTKLRLWEQMQILGAASRERGSYLVIFKVCFVFIYIFIVVVFFLWFLILTGEGGFMFLFFACRVGGGEGQCEG